MAQPGQVANPVRRPFFFPPEVPPPEYGPLRYPPNVVGGRHSFPITHYESHQVADALKLPRAIRSKPVVHGPIELPGYARAVPSPYILTDQILNQHEYRLKPIWPNLDNPFYFRANVKRQYNVHGCLINLDRDGYLNKTWVIYTKLGFNHFVLYMNHACSVNGAPRSQVNDRLKGLTTAVLDPYMESYVSGHLGKLSTAVVVVFREANEWHIKDLWVLYDVANNCGHYNGPGPTVFLTDMGHYQLGPNEVVYVPVR